MVNTLLDEDRAALIEPILAEILKVFTVTTGLIG